MECGFQQCPVTHLRKKETLTHFSTFKTEEEKYGVELKHY